MTSKNKIKKYKAGDIVQDTVPQDGTFVQGLPTGLLNQQFMDAVPVSDASTVSIEDMYAKVSNTKPSSISRYLALVGEHESFSGKELTHVNKNKSVDSGVFHINNRSLKTMAKKAKSIYEAAGEKVPTVLSEIQEGKIKEAKGLPLEIQKALALANTITVDKNSKLNKTKLDNYDLASGSEGVKDAWLTLHNRGKDRAKLGKAFDNSYQRFIGNPKNLELELENNMRNYQGGGIISAINKAKGFASDLAQSNSFFDAAASRNPMLESNIMQAQDFLGSVIPEDSNMRDILPTLSGIAGLMQTNLTTNRGLQTPDLSLEMARDGGVASKNTQDMDTPIFRLGGNGELNLIMPKGGYVMPEGDDPIKIPVYDDGGKVVRIENVDKAIFGGLIKGIGKGVSALGKGIGKGLGALSDVAAAAAPVVNFIPGVGQVLGPALGAAGGIGDFFQGGAQGGVGGLLGNVVGGAASGFGGPAALLGGALSGGAPQAQQYPQAPVNYGYQGQQYATPGFMGGQQGIGGSLLQAIGPSILQSLLGSVFAQDGGFAYRSGGFTGNKLHSAPKGRSTGKFSRTSADRVKDHDYRGAYIPLSNPTPIQAETYKGRREQIIFPTGHIADVNANESHDYLKKNGNGNIVTDLPSEGSYITSSYGGIKLKRVDLENFEVGLKGTPYSEHKVGKIPEIVTAADVLMKKGEKSIVPSEAAKRIKQRFPIKDRNDIFSDFTDGLNIQNRSPFIEAVVSLSEYERQKKELSKQKRLIRAEINPVVGKEIAEKLTDVQLPKPESKLFRKGGHVGKKRHIDINNVDKANFGQFIKGVGSKLLGSLGPAVDTALTAGRVAGAKSDIGRAADVYSGVSQNVETGSDLFKQALERSAEAQQRGVGMQLASLLGQDPDIQFTRLDDSSIRNLDTSAPLRRARQAAEMNRGMATSLARYSSGMNPMQRANLLGTSMASAIQQNNQQMLQAGAQADSLELSKINRLLDIQQANNQGLDAQRNTGIINRNRMLSQAGDLGARFSNIEAQKQQQLGAEDLRRLQAMNAADLAALNADIGLRNRYQLALTGLMQPAAELQRTDLNTESSKEDTKEASKSSYMASAEEQLSGVCSRAGYALEALTKQCIYVG